MAGGNIRVVVRVRPFNGRELDRKAKCVVQMKGNQTVLAPTAETLSTKGAKASDHGQKVFAFDKSYWSFNRADPHFAGQNDVFKDLGVPLLDNAFQGYNNCIFAYGQTGSGKSYSMMGYGEEAGVIPKICHDMFERITKLQEDKNLTCTVEVSYMEIYNERVRDLLNPTTKGNLRVREHPSTGPYVEDLAKLVVRSFKEIEHLMDEGNKARTVAATNMNETSSRSHAVFTLTLTQNRHDVETSMNTEKVAKISLVDLAGSERATSTGATGARLKEGAEINRSLSTLGRVIAALADLSSGKKKASSMVPYRDSVLTWLLKDSLGGNSMTAMIAAISPADINFEETLSTLRYADSAKRIKNHAVVNEDPNARMIRELKEELAQLRSKLGSGSAVSGAKAEENYDPNLPLDQQYVSIVQADGSTKRVSKAEIAEQLSQSEKLYRDLNQTWEEKLLKTEEIHKEREAALEELGISIEKGFIGLSTPKKMPHLVNLSDDPLLAECLIYNLKPGTTTVGNAEIAGKVCEIRLNGTKILSEHCTFENVEGTITLTPMEGAGVMVNGQRIDKPKRLRSGSRIILGDFHIFRFNHPQEARAERAERGDQSLLRHSIAASQLGTHSPRPSLDVTPTKSQQDIDGRSSRADSPLPFGTGRDSDWSLARREAMAAALGPDQKINHLTDEELDSLFDDIQKARAMRKSRPESRLAGPEDEESESIGSYPVRDKYLSTDTMDSFSLDTALTIPGTPQTDGDESNQQQEEGLNKIREDLQVQLDKQKEEYLEQLRAAEASNQDVAKLKAEKERVEQDQLEMKETLELRLKQQKDQFEIQLQEIYEAERNRFDQNGFRLLTNLERQKADHVVRKWRQLRNFAMAEVVLKKAALLKEAQVISQVMDKGVVFQFAVLGQGHTLSSSYDMVLNDIGIDGDSDEALTAAPRPCVAIRVIDYNYSLIHFWSIDKLEHRIQDMRKMHQYHDHPEYLKHFKLENPFIEDALPENSLIGSAHVPLTAVFEARVQDYAVDVISPYSQQPIGTLKLSLEPSSASAPATMIKFNIVMHEMVGYAEREGSDVHAQMSVSGISEETGISTTQMIRGFDEGAIKFESVHSMGVLQDTSRSSSIQILLFAKVTSMHLDKLISWDEVRELAEQPPRSRKKKAKRARLPETEYYATEQHDVFAKIQILELSETGEYTPVEVEQTNVLDDGKYQLRQGLQRRMKISLTHTASESMEWDKIVSVRVGNVRLVDPLGRTLDANSPTSDVLLKFINTPSTREDTSGTTQLTAVAQWDSSLHDSILLDRPTAEKYFVQVTVSCDALSKRLDGFLRFRFDIMIQVRPRSWIRPQSMFKSLWNKTRIVYSTSSIFSISLAPSPSKLATDLWRLDTRHHYVKGEEELGHWSPRGMSLINDFAAAEHKRQHLIDIDAVKASMARLDPPSPDLGSSLTDPGEVNKVDGYTHTQKALLNRSLALWRRAQHTFLSPIRVAQPPSPTAQFGATSDGASTTGNGKLQKPPPKKLTSTVRAHKRNPVVLKSGPVLMLAPNSPGTWLRRHVELRSPYLHLFSVPESEEVGVLNLRNATVDSDPEAGRLLQSKTIGPGNVWAVYATGNSCLFAARSEGAKMEWILAIDGAFSSGLNNGHEDGSDGEQLD